MKNLKISGNSMYPKYQTDDIVIFEKCEDMYMADNKDCACYINGLSLMKQSADIIIFAV